MHDFSGVTVKIVDLILFFISFVVSCWAEKVRGLHTEFFLGCIKRITVSIFHFFCTRFSIRSVQ